MSIELDKCGTVGITLFNILQIIKADIKNWIAEITADECGAKPNFRTKWLAICEC